MKFTIEITMDNAAFEPCNGAEVARILRKFADEYDETKLQDSYTILRDVNGNNVGAAVWR